MAEKSQKATSGKTKNLHAGHRERMRARFHETGFDSFAPHEIMEYLLFYVYSQGDTNEYGHNLINAFGSVDNVLRASHEELLQVKGIGPKSADFILFLREIYRAYQKYSYKGACLESIDVRCGYFLNQLAMESDENLLVACLNGKLCVQNLFTAAKGTPGKVHVCFQTLMRNILNSHCNAVILAHNHPKGSAAPSYEDIELTKQIAALLKQVDIHLEDHIIVGNGKAVSMSRNGTLMTSI